MSNIPYRGKQPIDGDVIRMTGEDSGQPNDTSAFEQFLDMDFIVGDTNHPSWEGFFSTSNFGPFTSSTFTTGNQVDEKSLQAGVTPEAGYQQTMISDLYLGLSSEVAFAGPMNIGGHTRQSGEIENPNSTFQNQTGSGLPVSEEFSGDTSSSLVLSDIEVSSGRRNLWKDIPTPGSVAPLVYCTLERFSRWLREREPYLPQETAERLKLREVRAQYEGKRRLYTFIRWAANDSDTTDEIPPKFCFLCFEAVGVFYPPRKRMEDAACICEFITKPERIRRGLPTSREYAPSEKYDSQQQFGLIPRQYTSKRISTSHETPMGSTRSSETESPASSNPSSSGLSVSRRSRGAHCDSLAPIRGKISASSRSTARKILEAPRYAKSDPLVEGPNAGDQLQTFIDESQRSLAIGQSFSVSNTYTMHSLPPPDLTFHNLAPALSNWTGPFGVPAQNLELGLPDGHIGYPPFRSSQQPGSDASSYPYYQGPLVDAYGYGQTGYIVSQATVPFTSMGQQDGGGSAYSEFAGEQMFVGETGPRDTSRHSHQSRGVATLSASNRSARTSTGTKNPLAPLGGGIPGRGRKQPPAKNTNKTKLPGPAIEFEYCTLKLFSKWLASCEPHKRQATVDELRDPDVRSWYRDPRWNLGAFCRWAQKESGREGGVKLKICGQCFHTYGKFYPQRIRVEHDACMCLPVDGARLVAELELPEEQRLGLGSAKYFPKHRPQFLE